MKKHCRGRVINADKKTRRRRRRFLRTRGRRRGDPSALPYGHRHLAVASRARVESVRRVPPGVVLISVRSFPTFERASPANFEIITGRRRGVFLPTCATTLPLGLSPLPICLSLIPRDAREPYITTAAVQRSSHGFAGEKFDS